MRITIDGLKHILVALKNVRRVKAHKQSSVHRRRKQQNEPSVSSWKKLKYIKEFLSPAELLIVRIGIFAIIASMIWIGGYGWKYGLKEAPKSGGVYTEGIVGQPVHINPLFASTNDVDRTLTKLIFAGLLRFDDNLQLIGDLAKDWEVSEDQKKYTFFLKEGITWPDGTQFTADDILFTIESIQNAEYLSPLRGEWQGIEIEKVNDYTVTFTLPEPFAPFLSNATIGILPAHLWQDIPPLNAPLAELNVKPVGLGAWRFASLTKDKQGVIRSYSLVRNEEYHGQKPWIESLKFKFYSNVEDSVIALRDRNVEGLSFLPIERKDVIDTRKDIAIYSFQLPQYTAIFFNQEKNAALESLNVRKALARAIDREKIVEQVLQNEGRVIDGPILQGYPGYNPLITKYEYDPLKAAELLEKEGWVRDLETKQRQKDEAVLIIQLTTVDQPDYVSAAEMIKKDWEALGVIADVRIVDTSEIQRGVIEKRDFEALLFGEILGSDPDPYPFWHSTQANENGLNLANFVSRKADTLIEDAREISDPVKRGEKYILLQDIIAEKVPAIFLYSPNLIYPVTTKIQGIESGRIIEPADRFNTISKWYIKTRKSLR